MFQKIKSYLSKGNRAQWCVFVLLALTIFIKCVLFHWCCFHSILISSLWKEPLDFFAFWLPKINIAILLASFVFIIRNRWWTIIMLLLIDLWCISNLMYLHANELLITCESILMIGNLKGFEESITTYWNFHCTIFLIQTLLYSLFLLFVPKTILHKVYIWGLLLVVVCITRISTQVCRYHYADKLGFVMSNVLNIDKGSYIKNVIPYREVVEGIKEGVRFTGTITAVNIDQHYLRYHSIISYFPKIFIAYFTEQQALKQLQELGKKIELEELNGMELFLNKKEVEHDVVPSTNLIVFIVESFEDWLIGSLDENNQAITPYINQFIENKANVYCRKIRSQVREGVSGDGQMIINTGILPLQKGSAALLFGNNVFPNWAHLFSKSATIYSSKSTEWNQATMTTRYNYQCLINPTTGRWEDESTMDNLLAWINTNQNEHFACQAITVSTHTPFVNHENSELKFSNDIPRDLQKYINCFHYADSCIGKALYELERDGLFRTTTIVITGDHTIFKKNQLKKYESYIVNHNLPINTSENYVPLIIYSPHLNDNHEINELCYQMDIYPTIMHLIGCEDYYWKGLGVNLLDSVARKNRPINEQEAFILSDKLIRANWFESYTKEQ